MKHIFILLVTTFLLGSAFAAEYTGLEAARELSQDGVIVNYSPVAGNSTIQEASLYKLNNALIRQEAVGIALRLRNITLPDGYLCNNYFRDTNE
jgi:hypothetical protein